MLKTPLSHVDMAQLVEQLVEHQRYEACLFIPGYLELRHWSIYF